MSKGFYRAICVIFVLFALVLFSEKFQKGLIFQPITSLSSSVSYSTTTVGSETVRLISASSTEPQATSTKSIKGVSPAKTAAPLPKDQALSESSVEPQAPPEVQSISFNTDVLNNQARSALVNIICTVQNGGSFEPISGSGVIISPDGLVLTNAHVAEYFLLKNFGGRQNFIDCTLRTGSPATETYTAELVYLPLIWVEDNADVIASSTPTGTGEHDYALLRITGRIDGTPLGFLPYLPPNVSDTLLAGNLVLLDSYPAGFLGGVSIIEDLYQVSGVTKVGQLFTFATSSIDVMSVPGTVVSQRGASGGAVVNASGYLAGIITTSSDASTTGARDLRAITLPYINRDLETQLHVTLSQLTADSQNIQANFNANIAPSEVSILSSAIFKGE